MTTNNTLPKKDEFAAAQTALIESEVLNMDGALNAMVDDFGEGRWTLDTLPAYLVKLRSRKPDLWSSATADKPDTNAANAAQADLAERAFVLRSAGARAELLKLVGPEATDVLAQSYGLKNHADFHIGKKPGGEVGAGTDTKPSSNPFYRLRDKKTGAINPEAQAEINRILTTSGPMGGTRFLSGLAKAANCRLDGLPLR